MEEKTKEVKNVKIEWKKLDGYSKYEISNNGLVRNVNSGQLVEGSIKEGYVHVSLYPDNGDKHRPKRVHKLVALLFCGMKDGCDIVNHLDGDKMNNHYSNLEWTTCRENTRHASRIGKLNGSNHKPVERTCIQTGNKKTYMSISEAHEDNKSEIKHASYIVNCCSGEQKTTGGYSWRYLKKSDLECEPPIDGKMLEKYSNYLITSDGKIYNKNLERYLRPSKNGVGYLLIDLYADEYDESKDVSKYAQKRSAKRKKFRVHVLVAMCFIPNPNNKPEVNHKNKIRTDNRVENLEWVTSQENMEHAHNKRIFQYTKNIKFITEYKSVKEASDINGYDHKNVSHVARKGYPYTAYKFCWFYNKPIEEYDEDGIKYIITD